MTQVCTGQPMAEHAEITYTTDRCPCCSAIGYAKELERLVDGFMNLGGGDESGGRLSEAGNTRWMLAHTRIVYPEFNEHPIKRPRPWIER